jgi:uncharacterized protein
MIVSVSEPLPSFRYHPDPVGTGYIKASSTACVVCGRERGFIYTGPVYAVESHHDEICPWCIADGNAARQFDAHFTDSWNAPDGVPMTVIEDITRRTPGFITWQDDHWLYHCGDGCAFLGVVGRKELAPYPDAIEMLLHENDHYGWSPKNSQAYVSRLSATGQPAAYLFRCLHCGTHLAFSDSA